MKDKPIRLTATSYALLALLDHLGEVTPYDIKQALERSIENFWQVPHTTAYDEPARLAAGGYLATRQEPGGRRRRLYAITEEGRAALRAWAEKPTAAPPQLRDELLLKLFAGADPTALLVERAAWHEAKLAELETYLQDVRASGGWVGPMRTLVAGVAYHRKMLEVLDAVTTASKG